MESIRYLIYYTHLYTFSLNHYYTPAKLCKDRIILEENDLHVSKLLKNVQSEPKLNSFYI